MQRGEIKYQSCFIKFVTFSTPKYQYTLVLYLPILYHTMCPPTLATKLIIYYLYWVCFIYINYLKLVDSTYYFTWDQLSINSTTFVEYKRKKLGDNLTRIEANFVPFLNQ